MSIQFNPNISGLGNFQPTQKVEQTNAPQKGAGFTDSLNKSLNQINDNQQQANDSIVDLLSGKQQDVNSVVASVAKADMSFKLLVGVRNKLVEAYKETMKMPV